MECSPGDTHFFNSAGRCQCSDEFAARCARLGDRLERRNRIRQLAEFSDYRRAREQERLPKPQDAVASVDYRGMSQADWRAVGEHFSRLAAERDGCGA